MDLTDLTSVVPNYGDKPLTMVHDQSDPDRISIHCGDSLLHCSIETTNLNSDLVPYYERIKFVPGQWWGVVKNLCLLVLF